MIAGINDTCTSPLLSQKHTKLWGKTSNLFPR